MHVYADRSRRDRIAGVSRVGRSRAGAHRRMVRDVSALGGTRPVAQRDVPGSRQPAVRDRRHGLRRRLPAADPPDRDDASEKDGTTACVAEPGDPGSPWAIGSSDGGHTAIERGLGTLDDFAVFREEAERLGLEIALDLAWQCSPDHPWVREHPDWFRHRPDGTIKYAENPPKKYQDIYPLDFECDDWPALWQALLEVTLFWIDRGVRIFRVDNPHTKTFGFWEWLIGEVQLRDPRVIFLAEAFTRPQVMRYLAKAGFTQSYTYFTWRNSKARADRLLHRADGDRRARVSPGRTCSPIRPTSCTSTCSRAAGRPSGPGCSWRRRWAPTTAFTAASSCARTARCVPAARSTPTRRSISSGSGTGTGPGTSRSWWRGSTRSGIGKRRCSSIDTLRFHETDNPQIIAFSKTAPRGRIERARRPHLRRRQPRSATTCSTGFVRCAVRHRPGGYRVRDLLDDMRVHVARRVELCAVRSGRPAGTCAEARN